jgi:hypothetical protein
MKPLLCANFKPRQNILFILVYLSTVNYSIQIYIAFLIFCSIFPSVPFSIWKRNKINFESPRKFRCQILTSYGTFPIAKILLIYLFSLSLSVHIHIYIIYICLKTGMGASGLYISGWTPFISFETEFDYVSQAGLELLCSRDLPLVSQVAETIHIPSTMMAKHPFILK